jgi:hypothetical protein
MVDVEEDHPIRLRMKCRSELMMNVERGTKLRPNIADKLWPSVRGYQCWNSKPGNPMLNECFRTSFSCSRRQRDGFWPSSGPVHYCEKMSVTVAFRERTD